jgi:hypothetical protein
MIPPPLLSAAMVMRTTAVAVSLGLLLGLGASASSVRLEVNPQGRKVILNENTVQLGRRMSANLLDIPGDSGVDLSSLISRHSGRVNLDERLVRAMIQVESGYNVKARSNRGAMGLMQLMPGTAADLAVHNPFDAEENLRGGTTYLRQMVDHFGRLDLAVAAYNAGIGTVERYNGIPPYAETIDYVRQVLALYHGGGGTIEMVPRQRPVAIVAHDRTPLLRKPHVYRNRDGRLVLTTALGPAGP